MDVIQILEVGIDKKGRLFIRPVVTSLKNKESFEFVYRAAMAIYWDKKEEYFHASTAEDEDMPYRKWFEQIVDAVKSELGFSLELSKATIWTGISIQFNKV